MKIDERFWSKVAKGRNNECWPWTRQLIGGRYGRFAVGSRSDGSRKQVPAHRVAYELAIGPIPAGHYVLHSCDNPPCCNPRHLSTGTQQQNVDDMIAKGRKRPAFGDRNGSRRHPEKRPRGATHWRHRSS